LVIDGLNNGAFPEQDFIHEIDETIFHIFLAFGNELQSLSIKLVKEFLGDITTVAK
jgi:hypothetical protein